MPTLFTSSDSAKRAARLIVIATVAIDLVGAGWILAAEGSARAAQEAETGELSKTVAAALDAQLGELAARIDLALLHGADLLQGHLSGDGTPDREGLAALERERQRLPGVRSLSFVRQDHAGTDEAPPPRVQAARPSSDPPEAGAQAAMTVSDPVPGANGGHRTLRFSRRLRTADGHMAGVVEAALDVDVLDAIVETSKVGKAGTVVLRDSRMQVIAGRPRVTGAASSTDMALPKAVEGALASGARAGTLHTQDWADGMDRIVTYRKLATMPFLLVASMGADDYLADWRQSVRWSLAGWLLLVACTALGARMLVRSIERATTFAQIKGRFLANMSHELRTPLNAIIGLHTLMRAPGISARQRDYLDKSDKAARSLLELINDILDYSKLEAGKLELESVPFSLEDTFRNLGVVLGSSTGRNTGVQLLFDIPPGLPMNVVGDELRLRQVLTNLASNALKFTEHGQVVVRVEMPSTDREGLHLRFSVVDSGIGIDPEQVRKIFSAFSQAEVSTTRKYGGSGLGLAISRRLVQMMGGELRVKSEPGRGSTFHFDLVVQPTGAQPLLAPAAAKQRRVLLIEPNPVARSIAQAALAADAWEVHAFDSAEAAWTALARPGQPWDLLCAEAGTAPVATLLARTASLSRKPALLLVAAGEAEAAALRGPEGVGIVVKPYTPALFRREALRCLEADEDREEWIETAPSRRLEGMHILVVEDNLLNQQVAEELLRAEGAEISLAGNGRAGFEAVRSAQHPFDLVLMDIHMPEMDGHEATRRIRALGASGSMPIVAMTASTDAQDRHEAWACGMNEHIGKPFELNELVALICSLANRPLAASAAPPGPPPADADAPAITPDADLDLEGALRRLGGQKALYVRAARLFVEGLEQQVSGLEDALTHASPEAAIRAVHTLKSTAAVLGANQLSQAAARLEARWKSRGLDDGQADVQSLRPHAVQASAQLQAAIARLAAAPA